MRTPRGVPLALAVLACGVAGCGSAGRGGGATASLAAGGPGGADHDGDADSGAVRPAEVNDGDDAEVVRFGHAASGADGRAIARLVRGYYAAAAARDSAKACSQIYYILEESMGEDYGKPPGPRYLQGAETCEAVLAIVFDRFHAQLAEPPRVTGVRVDGRRAYALLAWTGLPAGYMEVEREGRAWRIARVLAAQLP